MECSCFSQDREWKWLRGSNCLPSVLQGERQLDCQHSTWSQDCMMLPAQGERVSSTSVPLFSSLLITVFLWISSEGLLSGWQNTASGSLSVPVQHWYLHLRRCPWLCLLALSQSHILAVILWRFETGLFLGQQGYHPGVPSSLLNDSSLHHIPHVSAKQISLHWLSFQSLPRRTAFLQPGHRKGLCL